MSRSNFHTDFQPMDRVLLDGEAHRFIGYSASGYLFVRQGDGDSLGELTEIDAGEMSASMQQSGRLIVQPEHFKSRSRKK